MAERHDGSMLHDGDASRRVRRAAPGEQRPRTTLPEDRFDRLPRRPRVGVHRLVARPRRFWQYLVASLLAIAVLTGAGISTDSGIPDYRSPGSPPRTPMTLEMFLSSPEFRRHYWARNHLGWRHMDAALPNAAHLALTDMQRRGVVSTVITQNVDMLHTKAGTKGVLELHGCYGRVRCLTCDWRISRHRLAEELEKVNTGFADRVAGRLRERGINGPRGPLSGATIMREALQAGRWKRKQRIRLTGSAGNMGFPH